MNIKQTQNDIYAIKQLITIEKLRQYKHECELDDIDKSLTSMEFVIEKGV